MRRQEEQLLARFFEAARVYDRTVMAEYATVNFNPRTDGIVRDFEVVSVTDAPEGREATVNARVALPGGQTIGRTLRVTMGLRDGRLVITAIRHGEAETR